MVLSSTVSSFHLISKGPVSFSFSNSFRCFLGPTRALFVFFFFNFVYKLVVCLPLSFSIFLIPGTPWLDRLEEWAGREKTLLPLAAPLP